MERSASAQVQTPQPPPPYAVMLQMITGRWVAHAIHAAVKLNVADVLGDDGSSLDELARKTHVPAPNLFRLLRSLAGMGIFAETANGRFIHTPLSKCLRADSPDSIKAVALLYGEGYHNQAWCELPWSIQTGKPAFDHVFGSQFFDYAQKHAEVGQAFNDAMSNLSNTVQVGVIKAYDFSAAATVVDVGGGHGMILSTILKANPNLKGIVCDLPHVVAGAAENFKKFGVADRASSVGGNFFESVPEGADVYVLSHIIHDWDDAHCTTILKNIRRAMAPKAKVVLFESVVPPGNAFHFAKLLDLEMLVMTHGGKERTESEYAGLFKSANLRLNRIVPSQAGVDAIEGVI